MTDAEVDGLVQTTSVPNLDVLPSRAGDERDRAVAVFSESEDDD